MALLERQDRDSDSRRDSTVSFNTASSARSTRDSIIDFYIRDASLQEILSPRENKLDMTTETPIDEQRYSRRIEDYRLEIPNSADIQMHPTLSDTSSPVKLDPDPNQSISQQHTLDSCPSEETAEDDQKTQNTIFSPRQGFTIAGCKFLASP